MILVITSVILGFLGFSVGSIGGEFFSVLLGIMGIVSPALFVLEKIYKGKRCGNEFSNVVDNVTLDSLRSNGILENMEYEKACLIFNEMKNKTEFFDDVESSLKILKGKFILGVVSDTWPSLERVFINRGLRKYFSTFIMSSIYGSYKAEKLLFKVALEELNLQPNQAIFIDDNESNLIAAEEFGMLPILIDRYQSRKLKSKYTIIRSLEELSRLLVK